MRRRATTVLVAAALGLAGCIQPSPADVRDGHGRYSGVGIYSPGKQWSKLVSAQATGEAELARLLDDQAVIVVQDSATGEVRACGDLTGYCVRMNPWRTSLTSQQSAPVRLSEHRAPDAP